MKSNTYIRLSSNMTLFWKIFLPTFWFTFYGAILIAIWFGDSSDLGFFGDPKYKFVAILFFVLGSIILFLSILRFKRVEYKDDYFYISNYFRTLKVHISLVKKINLGKTIFFSTQTILLSESTIFGKSILLLSRSSILDELKKQFPELYKS